MKTMLCGAMAVALAGTAAHANTLTNPGFEDGLTGWTTFENAFHETIQPHSGAGHLKGFGPFNGNFATGAFQDLPATAGTTYTASAWVMTPSNDQAQGGLIAAVNIEWRDASGNFLSFDTVAAGDSSSTPDLYTLATLNAVAPAGAASARMVLLVGQPNFEGGSFFFDDASFTPAPGTAALALLGGLVGTRRRRAC